MRAINIEWDATKEEIEACELPSEVNIPEEISDDPEYRSPEMWDALVEHISDWLSDEFEFCHCGFEIKLEENEE